MSSLRDITAEEHYPTVSCLRIDPEIPDRTLVDVRDNVDRCIPVHVKSVHQMRSFARHVADGPRGSNFGLLADPGLGKSTRFPLMLAEVSKSVVLVVEYCDSLVDCITDGLTYMQTEGKICAKVPVVRYNPQTAGLDLASLQGPYVVVIAAKVLLGRIALGRSFPEAIVLHDESHYCDFGTFTWRQVVAQIPWVTRRVAMSATFSPSVKSDKSAIDGVKYDRSEVTMPIPAVRDWPFDVLPATAERPWTAECLRGHNTLVLSDDMSANRSYAHILRKKGFLLHVLASNSSPEAVRAARGDSYDRQQDVVIFGSSLYRNGFNFGIDVVIDCGMVCEQFIDDGKLFERYRPANRTEILQGAARVGRNRNGVAYRPCMDNPAAVPLLALGEVRHAAALHMVAGFNPSSVLVDLVPAVAGWSVEYARILLGLSLCDLVRKLPVADIPSAKPVDRSCLPDETAPHSKSQAAPVPGTDRVDLQRVLSDARDFELRSPHVDEVFTINHPGARYEVPSEYHRQPVPYWVGRDSAQRMLRRLLSNVGSYDVMMLTTSELRWFAAELVRSWNQTATDIVNDSLLLSRTKEVTNGYCLIPTVIEGVQVTKGIVAFKVRGLEAIFGLMRDLYIQRPYAVRVVDTSFDIESACVSPSARAALKGLTRADMCRAAVTQQMSIERLTINSDKSGPAPYTWYTNKSSRGNITRPTANTVERSSGSGSGY